MFIKERVKEILFYLKATVIFLVAFILTVLFQLYAWFVVLLALPYLRLTGSFEKPFKETKLFDSADEVKEWVKWFFEKDK